MALNISQGEAEVLQRLGNGEKRKEIAADLGISLSTVNNRIYDAQKKVGCRTSEHLLAWFIRDEVVSLYQKVEDAPVDV